MYRNLRIIIFAFMIILAFAPLPKAEGQSSERILITTENVDQLQVLQQIGQGTITSVALNPDESLIAIASSTGTRIYNFPSFTPHHESTLESEVVGVSMVEFSPDGNQLFTIGGCSDQSTNNPCEGGWLHIWDVATWERIESISSGQPPLLDFLNTPDGLQIVARHQSVESTLVVIDVETDTIVREFYYGSEQSFDVPLAISSDGQQVVLRDYNNPFVSVWSWDTQAELATFDATYGIEVSSVEEATFSPDNNWIAFPSRAGQFYLWDANTLDRPVSLSPMGQSRDIAFSPDSQRVATIRMPYDSPTMLHIWDIDDLNTPTIFELDWRPNHLFFTANGESLLIYNANRIEVLDAQTSTLQQSFEFPLTLDSINPGTTIRFTADNQTVVYASDTTMVMWDVETGEFEYIEVGERIVSYDLSPDGTQIVTGGWTDDRVVLWDRLFSEEGTTLGTLEWILDTVDYSPSLPYVASWGYGATPYLWNVNTLESILSPEWEYNLQVRPIFSLDGRYFVAALCTEQSGRDCFDGELRVLDLESMEEFVLAENMSQFEAIAFSQDGRWLAALYCVEFNTSSNCRRTSLYVWDMQTAMQVINMEIEEQFSGSSLRFVNNDNYLIAENETRSLIWQVPDFSRDDRYFPHIGVDGLQMTPDESLGIAFGHYRSDEVTIWNMDELEPIETPPQLIGIPRTVALSPDGTLLVAMNRGYIQLWGIR